MLAENTVIQVISLLLDVEEQELHPGLALSEIDGWDSVNALRVLVYLEGERGLKADYEQFMSSETLGALLCSVKTEPSMLEARG